jgi:Flp pilus assembly protein TadD
MAAFLLVSTCIFVCGENPRNSADDQAGRKPRLLETGKLDSAQAVLQQAEKVNPNDPETEYNLTLALNKTGRTEEARLHMQRYQHLRATAPHHSRRQQEAQSSPDKR